jgi:hypothetical protein
MKSTSEWCPLWAANRAISALPRSSKSPKAYSSRSGENRDRASCIVIHPRFPRGKILIDRDKVASLLASSFGGDCGSAATSKTDLSRSHTRMGFSNGPPGLCRGFAARTCNSCARRTTEFGGKGCAPPAFFSVRQFDPNWTREVARF